MALLVSTIVALSSAQIYASNKICPPIDITRVKTNDWMYAKKWSDGRWIFLSEIYEYTIEGWNTQWNTSLVLKLPKINDIREAKMEATRQFKTLQLVSPYPGDYDSCDYTPAGAGYSVSSQSPPMGP